MIGEVWHSFRRLPLWVQIWVAGILVPVNLLPLFFLGQAGAVWVAVLSVGGMALNLPILVAARGFSKAMALPHVVLWTPLVLLLVALIAQGQATGAYLSVLILLLCIDLISLAFDYVDAWRWWRGDRAIA